MSFADAANAAMDVWFAAGFAEAITYNGSDIYGHIEFGGGLRANATTATVEVRRSDVPAPAYRDAVVIDGVTWHVTRDDREGSGITGDGLTWRIPIIRDERPGVRR